jgi:hypothetical protein
VQPQRHGQFRRRVPAVDDIDAVLDSWLVADTLAQLSLVHRAVIVHSRLRSPVVSRHATTARVASWTALSGLELQFAVMTRFPVGQIGSIDIRLVEKDLVLLRTTF